MLFVGCLGSSGIGCLLSCYGCWLRRCTLVSLFSGAGFLSWLFWGGGVSASCQYRQDRKRRKGGRRKVWEMAC
ncbi:hypothetical protein LZ30DRAFT_701000 [Colletotrichum cereale]|nr:hypothetical protein LZ30DRAFT_701000 [Colletotrichum cereale]